MENCLVFSDILTEPSHDWYNQLSRSTRTSWKALLEGFMTKYGGKNRVSVGIRYYQARKQSNETLLEYLYCLNAAAIRAKIPIRDGSSAFRKEHVNPYIGTLDDRNLSIMLTILRLGDADDLEETTQIMRKYRNLISSRLFGVEIFLTACCATDGPSASETSSICKSDARGKRERWIRS